MKYIFIVTLFIQTYNGQVSLQKDLDEKTCKYILNTIRCKSSCSCIGLDENDEPKYRSGSCSQVINGSDYKLGECIK